MSSGGPIELPLGTSRSVGRSRLTGSGIALFIGFVIVAGGARGTGGERITPVLITILITLFVILAIGLVLPAVAVRRVQLAVTSPTDATVGDEVSIAVRVGGASGDVHLRALDPAGAWWRIPAGTTGDVPHRAVARGIFDRIRIEIRSSAPLGLFEARHVVTVLLATEVAVGPRALDVRWNAGTTPDDGSELTRSGASGPGESIRAVRPYTVGDPARLVHWPSTARCGSLIVKELEPPHPIGQVVLLDLSELGPDTENAASYAMGACLAVLDAGGRLILCLCDRSGARVEPVQNRRQASRLLAGAIEGHPGAAPAGWPVVEIGR